MKRFVGTTLLLCVVAVDAYAIDENQSQTKATVQKDYAAVPPKKDNGDNPPPSGLLEDKPRAVSQESIEYLERLRKNTPFGSNGFDLKGLRAIMGARHEPNQSRVGQLCA